MQESVEEDEAGLRVVVNLGVHALLRLLPNGRYLNLYERPVIGGTAPTVSDTRRIVDGLLGLEGQDVYFAAVALGGAGVRYYGEYCLVLHLEAVDDDPQLCDRDSYDVLLPPFDSVPDRAAVVASIVGRWRTDRHAMVALKVLPELSHDRNVATAGTISELVLKDQEFIEVHLRPTRPGGGGTGGFGRDEVAEVRQSPDEVAVATRITERQASGEPLSAIEDEWLLRRECVERAMARASVTTRVVTTHGKGYQWA